jgi:hypothetical protein
MLKTIYTALILVILFHSNVFAANPPGGGIPQVNYYTSADMCLDCNENQKQVFAMSLMPNYAVNESVYYIYIVDPVSSTKTMYEVEAFQSIKTILTNRTMTADEGSKFEPLMEYARNVVALKQVMIQKNANTVLNSESCDSALDAYSNDSCGAALMNELKNEVTIRNIFNFNSHNYTVTIGADAKILNGSINLQGQGNGGILRVVYNFDDGSMAVYKVKEGEIIELDTEFSKSAAGKTLKTIISQLDAEKFKALGIRGNELDDYTQLWGGHAGRFCNLVPSYKMVQAQVLQCTSTVSPDGKVLSISCRILGTTDVAQEAYTCS